MNKHFEIEKYYVYIKVIYMYVTFLNCEKQKMIVITDCCQTSQLCSK